MTNESVMLIVDVVTLSGAVASPSGSWISLPNETGAVTSDVPRNWSSPAFRSESSRSPSFDRIDDANVSVYVPESVCVGKKNRYVLGNWGFGSFPFGLGVTP